MIAYRVKSAGLDDQYQVNKNPSTKDFKLKVTHLSKSLSQNTLDLF